MARDDIAATLLLIEGDKDAREIFLRTISRHLPKIIVDVAPDAGVALEILGKKKYDVVVCDASLAREAKLRFASRLCACEAAKSVLVITAYPDFEKEDLPPELCVREILHKPLNLENIIRQIKAAALDAKSRI